MPGITRNGDIAGGAISNTQTKVKADSKFIIVVGDPIASHGLAPHSSATMSGASSKVKAGGKFVCRAGDSATCGHTANGSSDVNSG